MKTKQYFAALSSDDLARALGEKVKTFNRYIQETGLAEKWDRSYDTYFGRHHGEAGEEGKAEIVPSGDNGELQTFAVNNYRTNVKHMLAITTSQKPSYDPRAKNSDLESLQQSRLSSNILDSYLTEKRMGRHMSSAAERAVVMSKGFVYGRWNTALGRPAGVQPVLDRDGKPVMDEKNEPKMKVMFEGDPEFSAKSPRDIIYDPKLRDWSLKKWIMIRSFENRWDLAARYPQFADEIIAMSPVDEINQDGVTSVSVSGDTDELS